MESLEIEEEKKLPKKPKKPNVALTVAERIERIKQRATEETIKWVTEKEAKIEREVQSGLEKQKNFIIAAILGFENRYGEWSIDHCNGRSTRLDEMMRGRAQAELSKWIDSALVDLPPLKVEQKEAIVKEYSQIYFDTIRRRVQEQAVIDAEAYIKSGVVAALGKVDADELTEAEK